MSFNWKTLCQVLPIEHAITYCDRAPRARGPRRRVIMRARSFYRACRAYSDGAVVEKEPEGLSGSPAMAWGR